MVCIIISSRQTGTGLLWIHKLVISQNNFQYLVKCLLLVISEVIFNPSEWNWNTCKITIKITCGALSNAADDCCKPLSRHKIVTPLLYDVFYILQYDGQRYLAQIYASRLILARITNYALTCCVFKRPQHVWNAIMEMYTIPTFESGQFWFTQWPHASSAPTHVVNCTIDVKL